MFPSSYHRVLIFVAGLLLAACLGFAQDPHFNHYTEDEELSSNEVYGLTLDNRNVLYMNSDRGITVYDGYQFRVITTNDGLKDNCILRISKDINGRLWLTSLQNTANYLENGKIEVASFSSVLNEGHGHNHYVQKIFSTRTGQTLINFDHGGLFEATENGGLREVTDHLAEAGDANLCIFCTEDGYYWDLINNEEIPYQGESKLVTRGNRLYLSVEMPGDEGFSRKELVQVTNDDFFFSFGRKILHIKNKTLIDEVTLSGDVLSLYSDSTNGDLWAGVKELGACRFKQGDLSGNPTVYLQNHNISGILRDHEGNYWFSSLGHGVYMTNSLDHVTYINSTLIPDENRITALLPLDDQLLYGTFNEKLYRLYKNAQGIYQTQQLTNFTTKGDIRNLRRTRNNTVIVLSGEVSEIDFKGNLTGFKKFKTYPYEYWEMPGDTNILSLTNGLYVYRGRVPVDTLNDHDGYKKVTRVFQASDDTIWMSSRSYGLFIWDGKNDPVKYEKFKDFGIYRSNAMGAFNDYTILSPYGYGLFLINQHDTIRLTDRADNLAGNMIDYLLVDSQKDMKGRDSIIWTGSNHGISKITFPDGMNGKPIVSYVNTSNGLASNRIYSMAEFDGYIWAATGAGLTRIAKNSGYQHTLSAPVIDSVYINDSAFPSVKEMIIPARYPYNIRFKFRTISYHQPHRIFYYYYLHPVDDPSENWAMTTDREIRYTGLENGEYTLYMIASKSPYESFKGTGGLESGYPVTEQKIQIETKTIHQLWFRLMSWLLIAAGLALITYLIVLEVRKREENKQRLLQAEKQALLSQMNPHFIFNSLNSIQHYIIQQDAENANLYLAKFSQLIRRILDNSKKKWISLREEIETITLYLNLEKLRFEDNFDFEIKPDRSLDQLEILLPPMLVQPFIENAIWHGIMPLKEKGKLKISYQAENERMLVIVEDNGIGREESAKKSRIVGHVPTGLRNVNERIVLLNKILKEPIHCNIIDLKKKDGKPAGTRIELSVPVTHLNN